MKKTVLASFILLAIALTGVVYAQQKKAAISFDNENHNFGTFKEEKGVVSHKFMFTNTGGEPLIINKVRASCGCTATDYTKSPVSPGGKGFVKAAYNPRNRPGKFNKSVTVTSNAETPTKILRISGVVTPRVKTIEDHYPRKMDDLRLKSNHIAFTKIKNTEVKTDTLKIVNMSTKPLKVSFSKVPKHLTLKAIPETLKGKEKGIIVATYDAKKKNDWGYIIDRINILLNDSLNKKNRLSISANIEEDFSYLSEKDLEKAPRIEFESTVFKFDTIRQGEIVEHLFKFKNAGKNDLIIRKVKASCGCTAISPAEKTISGGKTSSIKVRFNSRKKKGRQNHTITIITNDPKSPSIRLKLTGMVKVTGTKGKWYITQRGRVTTKKAIIFLTQRSQRNQRNTEKIL